MTGTVDGLSGCVRMKLTIGRAGGVQPLPRVRPNGRFVPNELRNVLPLPIYIPSIA